MVVHTSLADLSAYADFVTHTITYKTAQAHPVQLVILIPKAIKATTPGQPIIFRIHGGGLFTGSALNPILFSQHILDLAVRENAIIVSPDYRLLPEATATDLLLDIQDAFQWLHRTSTEALRTLTNHTLSPDLTRVFVCGESAGGYLALQLSLSHPTQIRSTLLIFPMIDITSPWFTTPFHKQLLEFPQFPPEMLSKHKADVASGARPPVRSSDLLFAQAPLMAIAVQQGLYAEYLPASDASLHPLARLRDGAKLPAGGVLVLHGSQDSVVPVQGSRLFAEVVRETNPEAKIWVVERDGDHGFENEMGLLGEDAEWLRQAYRPVVEAWLA
jgi:acetyl esterase/lipase